MPILLYLSGLEDIHRNESGNKDFVAKSSDDFINLMSKTSNLPDFYVSVNVEEKRISSMNF